MSLLYASSSFGLMQGVAAVAIIAAIVTGIAAMRKLGPERDSLFITSAQGAATIMDNLISTLREEIDRSHAETVQLHVQVKELTLENEHLREENEGLRRRVGTRHSDS